MADEQLRLVAGLKDNATPGIRRINSELKTIRVNPGMEQAQKWVRAFGQDVALFKQSSMTIASVMSAMGIGGLAAAGSIGSLAVAFKKLAEHTLDVRELGREVGLTADEINAMNRAGQHFGFDPTKMESAIRHFAGLMPEFKRGYGELNNVLARQPDLIKRLRLEDTKTQIKEVFDFLGTIKNPQDRMVFERGIFGTDDVEKLFADGAGGFEAQAEKFRRTLAPITEAAAQQAQQLRDAINDFNAAVDNLEMKAGPTVYRWLTAGVTKLEQVLEKVQRHPGDAVAVGGVGAGAAATMLLRRRIMAGSALAGGTEMRAAAGQLSAAGSGMDKAAITLNEAAIALREAAVELRGRGGTPNGPLPGKPGAPEVVENAPKGILGGGGVKGLASSVAEGLFGAMIYKAGEEAMDAVLGWKPKDQQILDHATSLPNVIKDVREQLFGGLRDSRVKDDAYPAATPHTSTLSPESYWARKRGYLGLPASAFHPDDDRLSRSRASDAPDRTLDGVVVGALGTPVMHLLGTLKTAAAQAEADGIKPAGFHPGGLIGSTGSNDPVSLLAAGVKQGMLEAMREWAGGTTSADPSTARAGIMPASFGGGGGGGRNRVLGGGGFGSANLAGGDAQGAEADRIRELAKKYGIDPRVAVAVARSEGLGVKWGTGMDHGTSFGAFQLHVGGGLGDTFQRETGLDPRNQANAGAMDDWALKYASKNGWGPWHGAARIGVRGMAGIGGRPTGAAALGPDVGSGGASSRSQIRGDLKIGSESFRYGSGGAGGSASIPFGDYPINPDSKNPWGRAHNAMDVNGTGQVWDKALGRMRTGIELHAAHTAEMVTHGCLAFLQNEYPQLKQRVRQMIQQTGHAYLHINKNGASITPDQQERPDLGAEKRRLENRDRDAAKVEGGIDAHIHLHDNRTNTRVERRGVVRDSSITVRRAPQRTYTV